MAKFTVRYSHAAPFIREQLVHAVIEATAADRNYARQAANARAQGYIAALRILSRSDDQAPIGGIHNADSFPTIDGAPAVDYVRAYIGDDGAELLGLGVDD